MFHLKKDNAKHGLIGCELIEIYNSLKSPKTLAQYCTCSSFYPISSD